MLGQHLLTERIDFTEGDGLETAGRLQAQRESADAGE
jgi:hypothetical protein